MCKCSVSVSSSSSRCTDFLDLLASDSRKFESFLLLCLSDLSSIVNFVLFSIARFEDSGDFEFFLDSASLLFPLSVGLSPVLVDSGTFVDRFHFVTTLLNLIAFRTLSNGLAANSATESGLDLSTVLSKNEEENG